MGRTLTHSFTIPLVWYCCVTKLGRTLTQFVNHSSGLVLLLNQKMGRTLTHFVNHSSGLVYLKNRGGLEGHHVARANEALCDEPGKRTRRVVLGVIVDQLANPLNVLQPFLWSGFCETTTGQDPYPVREPFLWSGLLINMCAETAVVSNLHGTFIIMNLAQNVPLVLSKCVCVWTISKDVKLVTHHGQDPYPFLLPFLWSGIVVLQNWAGPLPSL